MAYKKIHYLKYSQEYEIYHHSSNDKHLYHKCIYNKNYELVFEQYIVRSDFVYNNNRPSQIVYKNGMITEFIVSNMNNHYHNDDKNIPALVKFNKKGEIIEQQYWDDGKFIKSESFYGMDD